MIYGERLHLSINPELWRPFFVLQDRSFRKCGEKSSSADQTDFLSNKTAGHKSSKEQRARRFGVFPALPKSESTKGVGKAIYATCIQ